MHLLPLVVYLQETQALQMRDSGVFYSHQCWIHPGIRCMNIFSEDLSRRHSPGLAWNPEMIISMRLGT